jgi:hypothetical protein
MHVHLPKPLHGWREFVGEVGIIVIGVLIALGAEQIIDKLHDRSVAAETRGAIRAEIDTDLAALVRRRDYESCVERKLDDIRNLLAQWGETGRFETPQWIGAAPGTPIMLTRYDAAVSAGRMAILGSDEQYRLGAVATGLRSFLEIESNERQAWGRLRALQAGSSALSNLDRAQLRLALQDASTLDYEARLDIEQQLPRAKDFGFVPDFAVFRTMMRRAAKSGTPAPSICFPIDTPRPDAERNLVTQIPL